MKATLFDWKPAANSSSDIDIRISRGNADVTVSGEDMTEFADKLMVIVGGAIPYRSAEGIGDSMEIKRLFLSRTLYSGDLGLTPRQNDIIFKIVLAIFIIIFLLALLGPSGLV